MSSHREPLPIINHDTNSYNDSDKDSNDIGINNGTIADNSGNSIKNGINNINNNIDNNIININNTIDNTTNNSNHTIISTNSSNNIVV